jgi:predicted acylesterase/phospholipase RssA
MSGDAKSDEPERTGNNIALALSGGGLRATLFELGILLYLSLVDELKHVKAVVSVSGGSILAAHFATRWVQATTSKNGFIDVAAELVRFTQSDIRNAAIISWIWAGYPRIIFSPNSVGKIAFLESQYRNHFGNTTLGDVPTGSEFPEFAFVATDTKKQQRVAIMSRRIVRLSFRGTVASDLILSSGVHLSLAVAASSSFPPVFEILELTHHELGLKYDEFDGALNLSDGGVSGNLGVEVLTALMDQGIIKTGRLLVCDAETGLVEEPSNNLLAVLNAHGAALSATARETVERLGTNALMLSFSNRTAEDYGLPFRVLTNLASYRTDLDRPTWQECEALITHGAAICQMALSPQLQHPTPTFEQLRGRVREVLAGAGCDEVSEPTEATLLNCGRRSYRRLWMHGIAAVGLFLLGCTASFFILSESGAYLGWWDFRPANAIYRFLKREEIANRDIERVATEVVSAVCENRLKELEAKLADGTLSQFIARVAQPTHTEFYDIRSLQPQSCDRPIECKFTFRGRYDRNRLLNATNVIVVGRINNISNDKNRTTAYVDLHDCYIINGTDSPRN